MEVLTGNVNEERHVPWVQELETGYRVTVGKPSLHPMDDIHYIEYVELYVDGEMVGKHEFQPGDKPEAEFEVDKGKQVFAREFCNLHGLWQGELE
ncbi:desulfoferrodoxin family protein [Candidatus Xianfuyuplasma coldseepsis]|uniref:Desulfoferrodoxin n=1 Tax=Candidatus Xianfuyuplasma coldseepsis TaxID=2782163 RepID=A0A7L7KT50_9MOLU|nr:desulfoferrodoxin family protein [Xianfuyuplasma coldseepsis]QMS85462.1 desulfoferrodoxin [Xianfuyuplasma coldseepsis]